jgi:hypothetical protein
MTDFRQQGNPYAGNELTLYHAKQRTIGRCIHSKQGEAARGSTAVFEGNKARQEAHPVSAQKSKWG